jgi:hypothetical protein
MEIRDAEYQFDRHKLTIYFEADKRIDFRDLVSDLFALYKTRIWMQQIDTSFQPDKDVARSLLSGKKKVELIASFGPSATVFSGLSGHLPAPPTGFYSVFHREQAFRSGAVPDKSMQDHANHSAGSFSSTSSQTVLKPAINGSHEINHDNDENSYDFFPSYGKFSAR